MNIAIAIVLDGLSYSAWLFLVSVGMTLVFGVLRILNIAHGAFYAAGAYVAAFAVGLLVSRGAPLPLQLLALTLLPLIVGIALGYVIERTILKPMMNEDGVTLLLATYALFLVLEDAIKLVSGGGSYYAAQPRAAMGQITVAGLPYATYDLVLILIAIALAVAGAWILTATRIGQLVVAVVEDREISAALGINVRKLFTWTFAVGAALGFLAGGLTAPRIAIMPGVAGDVIILAFAVVVIGGLGSIAGAGVGALIVGLCRALSTHLYPEAELFVIYSVMVIVLLVRPFGLFAAAEGRKI
ncbi:branched-chain amino acid ABC transporter permease [Pseudorhodoplanes sp.]|uniref:branched-chain amino acid ABC transporter permease n=1 Tax=Pseudorhodoplanes sp. TaxID=1934341 RepID=UPI003D1077A7